MAAIETWLHTDMKSAVQVVQLTGNLFSGDNGGNKICVALTDGNQPASISGTVSAYIIRSDGETVIQTGLMSGNVAYVTLPQSAYAKVGNISIVIKVDSTTVAAITSYVYKSSTDTIVDPGTIIPSVEQLIEAIADAIESVPQDYSDLNRIVSNIAKTDNISYVATDMSSNWEQGSINSSTGASSSSTTRIRSASYMKPEIELYLRVPVGYKAYWYSYTQPSYTYYDGNSGGWQTGDMIIPADGKYYRLLLAYTGDGTIVPSAAANCPLFIYSPTDKTLTLNNKSADAKTIGDLLKNTPVNMRWEQGRITTDDGTSAASSTRIRTANYMKPVNRMVFDVPSGYKAILFWYTNATYTSFVGYTSGGWTTDDLVMDNPTYFYKVCLAKSDDSDITPADAVAFVGHEHITRPYLVSTYDNTDRTDEIVSMLAMFGECELSNGDFYTTGIVMPDNSMITGCGRLSRIVLSANGNAVQMGSGCTLKDIDICGSTSDAIVWGDSEGSKNGVYYYSTPTFGVIENCRIYGFTGSGLLGLETGYGTTTGMNISDCNFFNCFIGINLKKSAEFYRFSNCRVTTCRYAVVNNGGNNIFANCTFASNTDHFVIDNTNSQAPNNAHGCAVGCNFQHSGFDRTTGTSGENGNVITLINTGSGYIFSGCVIGDGHVIITDCYRINFSGCQFMEDIYTAISGGGLVAYCGCEMRSSFEENTTITNNTAVRFDACYGGGGAVIDPTA